MRLADWLKANLVSDRTLSAGRVYADVSPKMGPNVRALMIRKMSRDAIPDGGGLTEGLAFLTDPGHMRQAAADAYLWAIRSCQQVRDAEDIDSLVPDTCDETIAAYLLAEINKVVRENDKLVAFMDQITTTEEPKGHQ